MALQYKNDSDRLIQEFQSLSHQNDNLYNLIQNDLVPWVEKRFGDDLTITMIYRTVSEQASIYQGKIRRGKTFEEKPWKSPHQFWHGVDIRSRDFTPEQIKEIENHLNTCYNQTNYYKFTAKCHNVGKGDHFHIQFVEG